MSTAKSKTVKCTCPVCGRKFVKPANSGKKFCCRKCKDKAYKAAKKKAAAKKPGAAPKKVTVKNLRETVKIPVAKKAVAKKAVAKKTTATVESIISVRDGNPFKTFFLATLLLAHTLTKICRSGKFSQR